ncbi:MAG: FlgD immunoglobulin-like domain containing protein [Bacteroidota bacterium]
MAYVYNVDNDDAGASGYGMRPPACGFVFLQGPRVISVNDTALYEGERIPGYKNLSGISHIVYLGGGGGLGWNDPPLGNSDFARQAYNNQNGLLGATAAPLVDPVSNQSSKFVFSGDPVTETGWIHTKTATAQDIRTIISSGPFTLAQGDTQEIVGAFIIDQGTDRLNSVVQLRSTVDSAQRAFDNNFFIPQKLLNPFRVSVSPFPEKIILEWGNPHIYSPTEQFTFFGIGRDYRFEGYNIYQYPENTISAVPKLIAAIDVKNNITNVSDWIFDPLTGTMTYGTVANGTDSGIRRYFNIEKDYFTGENLVKNKEYYYAVTSYYFNHNIDGTLTGVPKIIESPRIPFTVTPMDLLPGNSILVNAGQSLPTNHTGKGKDAVSAKVINPFAVSGGTYEVTFNGIDTAVASWNLKKISADPAGFILKDQTHFLDDDSSPIIDGIQFYITKPPLGIRRDTQEPKGYRFYPDTADIWFTAKTSNDAFGFMEAFNNGLVYPRAANFVNKTSKVKPWDLRKVEIRFSNSVMQKAYRYVDYNSPAFGPLIIRDSSFLPYLKNRGAAGAFIYQDFVDVPLTVWEVDSIDGDNTPRQLNAGFLEKNDSLRGPNGVYIGKGKVDGKWDPTHAPSGASELLFIFNSNYSTDTLSQYTRNPLDPSNNTRYLNLRAQLDSVDVLYVLWLRRKDSTSTFKEGDKFVITPNYPLDADDVFSIAVPKNTSVDRDREGIPDQFALYQNFPNPFNPVTTISFQVAKTEMVKLKIYNILGQEIKTLISEVRSPGYYSVQWNGTNEQNTHVSTGMYLYVIRSESFASVKKMLFLK